MILHGNFSANDINVSLVEIFANNKYLQKIIYLRERLWHTPLMKTHGTGVRSAKEFEKWMMDNGLSYSSIASACRVSERTVRQWVSQRGIPERFSACLKGLVESSGKTVSFVEGSREGGLKFKLSLDDYAKLSRKALESGCSLEELVARHFHSIL